MGLMGYHEQLKRRALKGIRDLHADTSVSPEPTHADLGELVDEIEIRREAIENDLMARVRNLAHEA